MESGRLRGTGESLERTRYGGWKQRESGKLRQNILIEFFEDVAAEDGCLRTSAV